MELTPQELKAYEKMGIAPPSITPHGVSLEDIRTQMKVVQPTNWHQIGNQLHCDTEIGPMAQTISTDYILTGTDEQGMPILTKVML